MSHDTTRTGGHPPVRWMPAPDGPLLNGDLVMRLARERDHLVLLHEALAHADQVPDLEGKLRVLLDAIRRIGFGRVVITLRDAEMEPQLVVTAGLGEAAERDLRQGGAPGTVWKRRLQSLERHRISHSYYLDSHDPQIAQEFGTGALPSALEARGGGDWSPRDALLVPVTGEGGVLVATLILDDPSDRARPTVEQVRTVELFAQQIGATITRMRLAEEGRRERSLAEALAEVARAVNATLRPVEVHQLILRHAVALLHAEGAGLALRKPEGLEIVASIGRGVSLADWHAPLADSVSGRALREGVPVIVNQCPGSAPGPGHAISKVVVVPLVTADGPVGVLAAANRHADFTESDAVILQRLADQVGVALVNARLFDHVAMSEARYRNLFEHAHDGIYTLDAEGRFTSVNLFTSRSLGVAPDDLVGRAAIDFVDPGEGEWVAGHFQAALAGEARRYECHLVRADGARRLISVTNTPIMHDRDVVGVLGIGRDITDDRERERALARSEARYTRLVESASDAIFTVDTVGQLTSVNRALERSVGRDRQELLGTPFLSLVESVDVAEVAQLLHETLEGRRRRGTLRYRDAEGTERHGSLMTTPIFENGQLSGALGIVRDVTDERRLAEQLLQQEKLAALGQLVSGVAHELNNPLAGVIAFSQLLLAEEEGAVDQRRAIETIHDEARRAAKIVSNLLTFARQHSPERRTTDLNQVVLDTLELRGYAMRVAGIELEPELDPALPLTWADPFQLQQVFLNLLGNAEQALRDHPGDRRVTLRTAQAGDRLHVIVTDTGPGIPPEYLGRIFDPFFTTKPVGEGTGLGLSISDGIVREHGGRILAENTAVGGARFVVELPLVDPAEAPCPAS
ncbi:MAG TPA: PAS domain S-box protein [Gemmatimonadaceae bacterium]